jgi:hypothetical protein
MFGKIDERCKILNDVTALITNRADEDSGASILAALKYFSPAAGRTFELGFA